MVNPLASLRQHKLAHRQDGKHCGPPNTERTLLDRTGPGVVVSLWMALGGGALRAGRPAARVLRRLTERHRSTSTWAPCSPRMGSRQRQHQPLLRTRACRDQQRELRHVFLLTFPIPFGIRSGSPTSTSTLGRPRTSTRWSPTASPPPTKRTASDCATRASATSTRRSPGPPSSTTTLAQIDRRPGNNCLPFLRRRSRGHATCPGWKRNFAITVDGESTPQIVATGTEDWFDSGWYFQGRRDYNTSFHSYVGTNQPAGNVNVVGMATDLWSKWGGVPFATSAVIRSLPEVGCTTGDTLCWCILYYQQ